MRRAISTLALALAVALAGCGRPGNDAGDCACATEPVVDAALLAFLSKARAAHHQADMALDDGNLDLAIAALEPVASGPRPVSSRGEVPPEVAEVIADTRARLADLKSDLGHFAAAAEDVAQGIALATKPTHFRGHLYEVGGIVHERQAKALAAQGDTAGAAEARAKALDAFEMAIKIQDQVITEALGNPREAVRGDVRLGGAWTRRQRLKNDLLLALIRAALAIVTRLPHRAVAVICRGLGVAAWIALPRERARVRARLEAGLGAPVAPARAREVFRRAGETLADTLALLDPGERASRTLALAPGAREAFREALARGRGVVFVSAHLGPWERLAALLVEEGFPVATVARESYDPRLTGLYDRLRAPRGVRSLYRGRPGAAAATVRELREGRAVGFLVDLPSRVPCERVPLFGAEADVPVGAARVALRRGAAVVVGTCGPGPWVGITAVETGDLAPGREGDRELTRRLGAELGGRIRSDPEAWLGLFVEPRRG